MEFTRDVEKNSVSLRLRKTANDADISSHTVLTDDVFQYVDFYFKTHKRVIKESSGKPVEQNQVFYWQQAKNFYDAAKMLPIESAPLPMYYCMLNAVKAFLLFASKDFDSIQNDFNGHGLKEGNPDNEGHPLRLDNITVKRESWGVFYRFAKTQHSNFDNLWSPGKTGEKKLTDLMYQIPFIHSAYISTYNIPRKYEKFIPLVANQSPRFMYAKDNRIRLVVDLDRHYFKQNAAVIPDEIRSAIPDELSVNDENSFQLISKESFKKKEIDSKYNNFRCLFSYISANKRIWYLKKKKASTDSTGNINTMVLEIAIVHRFSEIVRYKPEQMVKLLSSKENWLIHEFLSLVLDQFMDEIACEITKQEIMPTRIK